MAILTALLVLVGLVGTVPAQAASTTASDTTCHTGDFKERVLADLERELADSDLVQSGAMTINEVDVDVNAEVVRHYSCTPALAVEQAVTQAHAAIESQGLTQPKAPGLITPLATREYTASVWAGVPAIGHGHVKQDFRATVNSGKISGTVVMLGISRLTGASIGSWSHNRSWPTKLNNNTRVEIRMKGTLTYGIKDTPLSVTIDATFLDKFRGSGGVLQHCNVNSC